MEQNEEHALHLQFEECYKSLTTRAKYLLTADIAEKLLPAFVAVYPGCAVVRNAIDAIRQDSADRSASVDARIFGKDHRFSCPGKAVARIAGGEYTENAGLWVGGRIAKNVMVSEMGVDARDAWGILISLAESHS